MRSRGSHKTAIAGFSVAVLVFAGCGGDSEPTQNERPADIGDTTPEPEETIVAATPTAVPATIEPEGLSYTVQEGDLMGSIAAQFDVPLGALVFVNELDNPDLIQVGQEIVIPNEDDIAEWEAAEAAATPTVAPTAEPTATDG